MEIYRPDQIEESAPGQVFRVEIKHNVMLADKMEGSDLFGHKYMPPGTILYLYKCDQNIYYFLANDCNIYFAYKYNHLQDVQKNYLIRIA